MRHSRGLLVVPFFGQLALCLSSPACGPACETLRGQVSGEVVCDVDTYAFNWGNDICEGILPLCVLRPSGAADVAAAVLLARSESLPLSYRSGGHSYTCNGIKSKSLHIDLRSLNSTSVHPAAGGRAGTEYTFGSGNTMRQLLDALPDGNMIVHGQCPTVGAGGLFLHGGYHTILSLQHGRGNDTVTAMEVVTSSGAVLQLSDALPEGPTRDLWRAMRQAGSSFAIATSITVKVIENLPKNFAVDGGDMFKVYMPRSEMFQLLAGPSHEVSQLSYLFINGADFLVVGASSEWQENRLWLEKMLRRNLTTGEVWRSKYVHLFEGPMSRLAGGDAKYGKSGTVPYLFSSQEAFSTYSVILPMSCFLDHRMQSLFSSLPDMRDNSTDLGCYFQVTTTYNRTKAFIDYNCAYDSIYYRGLQQKVSSQVDAICPVGTTHYVNTPSSFLTARDYYTDYDWLAGVKTVWDPDESFRVYQGIRPVGIPPDAYQFERPYVRPKTLWGALAAKSWKWFVNVIFN